jgi:hypothetical protein
MCLATLGYNGPFFDEGIYVTAGLRILQGHGYSDGYLGWFAGSLLWPALAGSAYSIGGLLAARFVATLCLGVALLVVSDVTRTVFGERAGLWATLAFALNGPVIALARLAVYDVVAVAGVAVSFWAIVQLARRDNRAWLVLAALAFTAAALSKYPSALMILPLCGVLWALRRERAVLDIFALGFISVALLLMLFLPAREQVGGLLAWQIRNKPTFGSTRPMMLFAALWFTLAPALLACLGWRVAGSQRRLATILSLSLLLWPAYHLLSGNPVGDSKHVILGYLFAYPLIGLALATWSNVWKKPAVSIVITLALAGFGYAQWYQLDRSWPDLRLGASYLNAHVRPGDRLLINESWPYTMYLYGFRRITSPWDVFDAYRVTNNESPIGLCDYDWFVDTRGAYEWPAAVQAEVARCGVFERVFSDANPVLRLGSDLRFVRYPIYTDIWRNASFGSLP